MHIDIPQNQSITHPHIQTPHFANSHIKIQENYSLQQTPQYELSENYHQPNQNTQYDLSKKRIKYANQLLQKYSEKNIENLQSPQKQHTLKKVQKGLEYEQFSTIKKKPPRDDYYLSKVKQNQQINKINQLMKRLDKQLQLNKQYQLKHLNQNSLVQKYKRI